MEKKKFFLLTTLLCILSFKSFANFETFNYTDEDSSVRVTSGKVRPCSPIYTPKRYANGDPGHSFPSDSEIKGLCITNTVTCSADIFASANCTGVKTGHAVLDMKTLTVIDVKSDQPERYKFELLNNGTQLNLRYVS